MRSSLVRRAWAELIVAGFALLALLVAQVALSAAIHGTNYGSGDGKMAQATIVTAFRFAGRFSVTNISPIQGVGSQMLPKNVWANPAFWPFAVLDKELATDVSALVALGIFATACYVMARCFDVPTLPSAVAAQLCVVLFAPVVQVIRLAMVNFVYTPGDAVVFAPHMVALGLLARLGPESWRAFGVITSGILALLFYGLYCDPLWTMVSGIGWAMAFAVVTFGPLRRNPILARVVALGSCFGVLFLTGIADYLYTVSHYTARVQFADVLDRVRMPEMVSAVFRTSRMKYVYLACVPGWVLGLWLLRGRPRLLVVTGSAAFGFYLAYCVAYLLLTTHWVVPIPSYIEHSLFALFVTAAVAGYWGALNAAASRLSRRLGGNGAQALARAQMMTLVMGVIIVALVPARMMEFAVSRARPMAERFVEPWPKEPELGQFLADKVRLTPGQRFRGSVGFAAGDYDAGLTMAALWVRGIPTANEYSQMVSPQATYFVHILLEADIGAHLNRFVPWPGRSSSALWKMLQALGVRYVATYGRIPQAEDLGYRLITLPRRPRPGEDLWFLYEFPHPNVGDYSPTEVATAGSAPEIMAAIATPKFDFTRQAVLTTTIAEPLVPARGMRLSVIRGGLHVAGRSDGTSLVVLPQQFSNCLRARDGGVRLVRADLMLTGLVFSGDLDTDIVFDYGLFSPSCRWADLADMKGLGIKVASPPGTASRPGVNHDWRGALARLRTVIRAIQ